MTQLTVVAKIKAKPGCEAEVHRELLQLISPTLAESGCLNYDLHRSIEHEALFLFYENWENRFLWEQHMDSEHIQAFRNRTEGLLEDFEILLMQQEKPAP